MAIINVPVKSAWSSKINWTQVVGTAASAATWATGLLPAQYAALGPILIQATQGLATWYFKTFDTTTITPSSAAKLMAALLLVPFLLFSGGEAKAACRQLFDDAWSCQIPTKTSAPTCHVFGQNLVCTAPVVSSTEPKEPSNCGWSKKTNKYVCW